MVTIVVMAKTIRLDQPEEHDYPAAVDYLSLVLEPGQAKKLTNQLQQATTVTKKAKDILRASRLQPLGSESVHVRNDLRKIHHGQGLSPVLLIRGDANARPAACHCRRVPSHLRCACLGRRRRDPLPDSQQSQDARQTLTKRASSWFRSG